MQSTLQSSTEFESMILQNFRGMNRVSSRLNMSPEFAWNISNGYIKKDVKSGLGVMKQRPGITKFNTVTFTNACKYIYEPKWDAGGTDVIIREGTRWAKFDGVNTFADFDTGRTDGVRGMAAMFGNQLIMVDGGVPRKSTAAYSLSALSADANMPQDSTAVHVHQHKVWLNSDANPMKAYCSKTDSANGATSWTGTTDAATLDFSRILPAGDRLIGFATFAEVNLIFIFNKYAVVYTCGTDPTAFALQQIIPLNCISGHAIKQIGNDLGVCSIEGFNSFRSSLANQDLDTDDLSKYISPLYRDLIAALSDPRVVTTEFSHKLNHLYIAIPGTDPTILVYSVDIQNFVGVWTGYACHSLCERKDGTMLVGGNGFVYTMNSGTSDAGTAISFSYDFPFLYDKDPNSNKAFRQIEGLVVHDGNPLLTIDYSYATDVISGAQSTLQHQFTSSGVQWDASDATWDVASWAGSSATPFLKSDMLGRGKYMALTLGQRVLDATIEIPYIILRYKKEGIKIR